jgi:putative ATP-binding cassette transporter
MKLFSFLLKYSKVNVIFAAIIGIISGGVNGLVMAMITSVLSSSGNTSRNMLWAFVGIVALALITNFLARYLLIKLSEQATFDLRMHLCKQILAADLRGLEEAGTGKIFSTLTQDIPNITRALLSLPFMMINIAILAGCMVYLGMLSILLLVAMVLFLVFGIYSFGLPRKRAARVLRLAREESNNLVDHFHALTSGTKELKLHKLRRKAFLFERIQATAEKLRKHMAVAATTEAISNSWGSVLYFIFIGLLLFALPKLQPVTVETLTAYIITFLYIRTPIASLVELIPTFVTANISLKMVQQLGLSLASFGTKESSVETDEDDAPWHTLQFVSVMHTYYRADDDHNFTLGPLDLTIRQGEMVFLMGGNGSGKTTFAKLLTGLYAPESGEIWMDGNLITEENRDDYRQYFSAVFSDFYLFELLGLGSENLEQKVGSFLSTLQLDKKVEFKDGNLSTVKLSQGQRKRLALLTAYIEDRPIYVFDEWAADQDPTFKAIFYLELLPALKSQGKTIVVITHDDRYYQVADRVIKLESGRIESDEVVARAVQYSGEESRN